MTTGSVELNFGTTRLAYRYISSCLRVMEAVLKQLNAPHLSNHYVKWYLQQILSENGIVFIETIPLCKVKMSRLARL